MLSARLQRSGGFDVRVLCATNQNLEREVKDGRFREELLYRINVITIKLPALRERQDDIPLLANHFLRKYEKSLVALGDAVFQGRDAPADQLRVAGQRARAGKHHRARCDPGRDRRHSFARSARQAAQHVAGDREYRELGADAGGTRARAYQARADKVENDKVKPRRCWASTSRRSTARSSATAWTTARRCSRSPRARREQRRE